MAVAMYVHIPFCNSICSYCDFTRVKCNDDLIDKYLNSLEYELNECVQDTSFKTIYIGGGTPTSLNLVQLERLLKMLFKYTREVIEYTIEVNPETIDESKVQLLKKYKINRVSIGVQTTSDRLLQRINRNHSWNQVKDVVKMFNENGIFNISLDCLYSLPTQSCDDVKTTLQHFIDLGVSHISLYSLTIEENSVFGRDKTSKCSDELEEEMYFTAINLLKKSNYSQYEISNFAKNGFESLHNQVYWNYEDFYGVGLGASGKYNHQRYDNTTNFIDYFKHQWKKNQIELSLDDEIFEALMMGLRLKKGIYISDFNQRFNIDLLQYYKDSIDYNVKKHWLEINEGHLRCTDGGYPLLNSILGHFI